MARARRWRHRPEGPYGGARRPAAAEIWDHVSRSPLGNLWNFQGASPWVIVKRTAKAFMEDNLLARAAELGYYFLFALFPTLVFVSSVLGAGGEEGHAGVYRVAGLSGDRDPALGVQMVMDTFNQTTQAATGGKITFGLVAALWSASVGFAAIQDTANVVYKARETRPYWKAQRTGDPGNGAAERGDLVTLAVLLLPTTW